MRAAGYTAVGEFHYLGVAEALAAAEAAAAAGVELVLLHVAYARGGLPRFRQESVAAYFGRGRGAPRRRAPGRRRAPLRARVPRRLARGDRRATPRARGFRSTCTPTSSRGRSRSASPSTAAARSSSSRAPAASASGRRSSTPRTRTARSSTSSPRSGATICACPTTEADLGDGFLPAERIRTRSIPLCIGSDSNVRIDPLEELRELEGIARRQTGRRGVFTTEELLRFGSEQGARALGLDAWPEIEIDLGHRSLAGVTRGDVPAALVAGCGADVVAPA